MIDSTLLRRAEDKSLLTLKGNYVLVEMSFISAPIDLYKIIFQLKVNDYIPVIAHPERYMFLFNSFDEYHKLKRVGCKFQINLLSTTNFYGNDVCKICDKLLKSNLVNFVGSDIHSQKHINKMKNNVEIKNLGKLQIAINSNKIFK